MTTLAAPDDRRRILALDGGGVRGVVELAFLEKIEALLAARTADPARFRLCQYFDLVGGTSTGAIIAAGLATGRSVAEIRALYDELAPRVFRRPWWRLTGLQSRFAARPLAELLNREFADMTLADDRICTRLAVIAKRVDTGAPWIMSNIPTQPYWEDPPGGAYLGNKHYSLPMLIRASTAAPYYFGPERIPIEAGAKFGVFVDGGVTPYNNPSIPLLMLATMTPFGLRWALAPDRMLFISIGTGAFRVQIPARGIEYKPASKFALDTIIGLMGDCQMMGVMMMQWLGQAVDSIRINSEIGTLGEDYLAGRPLFAYQRYDIELETAWLRKELGYDAGRATLARLRRMDDPGIMGELFSLASAAAERQVRAAHFPEIFNNVASPHQPGAVAG